MDGRAFGGRLPNNANVTTNFWGQLKKKEVMLYGWNKSLNFSWKIKISLMFLTKFWVKNQSIWEKVFQLCFFLVVTVQKRICYDKTRSYSCVGWNKVLNSKQRVCESCEDWQRGPSFGKGFPQKWKWEIEFRGTNCEEWVHWTNQKHPNQHDH